MIYMLSYQHKEIAINRISKNSFTKIIEQSESLTHWNCDKQSKETEIEM